MTAPPAAGTGTALEGQRVGGNASPGARTGWASGSSPAGRRVFRSLLRPELRPGTFRTEVSSACHTRRPQRPPEERPADTQTSPPHEALQPSVRAGEQRMETPTRPPACWPKAGTVIRGGTLGARVGRPKALKVTNCYGRRPCTWRKAT